MAGTIDEVAMASPCGGALAGTTMWVQAAQAAIRKVSRYCFMGLSRPGV